MVFIGTGSTSLTHSIARALQPHGRLFSFEFQKERYENAVKIIQNNSLNNVVLSHRNVIESGFGMIEKVDASLFVFNFSRFGFACTLDDDYRGQKYPKSFKFL